MISLLTAGAGILLAFWLFQAIRGLFTIRKVIFLGPDSKHAPLQETPLISVLVPARNEEEIVEACLRSVLAQDYPRFEVIAVDDDSTDATGRIMDELAAQHFEKLRVLHVRGALPPGWVGKHYALTLAAAQARGEFLVLTDSDMIYHPATLSCAIERASAEKLDLLSLLPKAVAIGFWERLVMPVFGVLLGIALPLVDANNPRKRKAIAAGGFILIRRAAFDAVGGFEPVADHIVDDVLLAIRVKERGFRTEVVAGEKLLSTRMYDGFAELWEGIEKSASAAMDFRWHLLAATLLFVGATALSWFWALAGVVLWVQGIMPADWDLFFFCSAATALLVTGAHAAVSWRMDIRPFPDALLFPLGYLFYAAAVTSSFVKGRLGKGVTWKGRNYYGAGVAIPKSKMRL